MFLAINGGIETCTLPVHAAYVTGHLLGLFKTLILKFHIFTPMIRVKLKVRHFYIIAHLLFREQASYAFSILQSIKKACENNELNSDVTIEVNAEDFLNVYRKLSVQPEGKFADTNKEIYEQLLPQIQEGVAALNKDWVFVSNKISSMRKENADAMSNNILFAINKLF